jgi:hypothetical protein
MRRARSFHAAACGTYSVSFCLWRAPFRAFFFSVFSLKTAFRGRRLKRESEQINHLLKN